MFWFFQEIELDTTEDNGAFRCSLLTSEVILERNLYKLVNSPPQSPLIYALQAPRYRKPDLGDDLTKTRWAFLGCLDRPVSVVVRFCRLAAAESGMGIYTLYWQLG